MQPRQSRACAKVNLSLRILAREATGYHQIETLFCALELCDDIAIAPAPRGVSLDVQHEGPGDADDLGPPDRNLAVRAAALFLRSSDRSDGLHIRITKRIPAGAGLGGGSSDAAAVLRMLHEMQPDAARPGAGRHGRAEPTDPLALGAELGSDVPFFVSGAALALAWGRGERVLPVRPLPSAHVLLVIPPERVATADAYAALPRDREVGPAVLRAPVSWEEVAASARNDFEPVIFSRHPRLGGIRDQLEAEGAVLARMTGSGSVLFGVFEDRPAAARAADGIKSRHADVTTLLTRTAG